MSGRCGIVSSVSGVVTGDPAIMDFSTGEAVFSRVIEWDGIIGIFACGAPREEKTHDNIGNTEMMKRTVIQRINLTEALFCLIKRERIKTAVKIIDDSHKKDIRTQKK